MAAIGAVHAGDCRLLHRLNSAYMILLSKKEDAICVGDYRPISLVHSFAKLVTKILANRLAPKLQLLVSNNQSAFIRVRCIHDNFALVQHMVRYLHARKIPVLMLKIDITKAFDSVSWAFLLEILEHLGFGPRWRNLVSNLLRTSTTRVMLNGQPGGLIQHRRGLRQGDPLSPMLFILVMDVLTALIAKAEQQGLLKPLMQRSVGHRVSIYEDDVVLFTSPDDRDIDLIVAILDKFGEATGLRANLAKSSMIPIRCSELQVQEISQTASYVITLFPSRYLGLPLSIRKLTRADLQHLIDKIADKLPGWKAALLDKAGRLILVRAVLTAIPIYTLIAMDLPKWVIKALEKIIRAFLWRGRKEARQGHCPVAWDRVARPLHLGELGIHNLKMISWALRMHWLWLQKTQPDKPWAKFSITVPNNIKAMFHISVVTEVGDGNTTLFWQDKWIMGHSVVELAPSLMQHVKKQALRK